MKRSLSMTKRKSLSNLITIPSRLTVKSYQVTQDELLNGYQRQQAYTKRSQELAEQRKAFEQEAAQVSQMRDNYAQQLEQLSQQLQQVNQQEPDWAELAKQYSAEELIVYKAQLDQQKEYARQVEQERKPWLNSRCRSNRLRCNST